MFFYIFQYIRQNDFVSGDFDSLELNELNPTMNGEFTWTLILTYEKHRN